MSDGLHITNALNFLLDQNPDADNPNTHKYINDGIAFYKLQLKELYKKDSNRVTEAIYEHIDRLISKMPKPEKSFLSCKKGCSHCCRMNVTIVKMEAKVIVKYCKDHKITIDKDYLKEQLLTPEDKIWNTDIAPCVFLKNDECSIYPVRPIACRKYFVGTPPDYCNVKKYPNYRPGVYISIEIETFLSAVFTGNSEPVRMPQVLLDELQTIGK